MHRPWYCFPISLLGLHRSMWCFAAGLLALYATYADFIIWVVNQAPVPVEVQDVVSGAIGWRRWVEVKGPRIHLEPDLFPMTAALPADFQLYDQILLDRASVHGARWRRIIDQLDAHARAVKNGDEESRWKEVTALISDMNRFRKEPAYLLPAQALVILPGTSSSGSPASTVPAPHLDEGSYPDPEKVFAHWSALIGRSVEREAALEGFLLPLDKAALKGHATLGTDVARVALRVGGRPAGLRPAIFMAAIFTTLALGFAFYGIWKSAEDRAEPADQGPSPENHHNSSRKS